MRISRRKNIGAEECLPQRPLELEEWWGGQSDWCSGNGGEIGDEGSSRWGQIVSMNFCFMYFKVILLGPHYEFEIWLMVNWGFYADLMIFPFFSTFLLKFIWSAQWKGTTYNKVDDTQKHQVKCKEPDTKGYIVYESISIDIFYRIYLSIYSGKGKITGIEIQSTVSRNQWGGLTAKGHQEILGVMEIPCVLIVVVVTRLYTFVTTFYMYS